MEPKIKTIYDKVLEECKKGRIHKDLKILYQSPYRDKIDWTKFPAWAIPNAETEGCHEG